MSDSPRWHLDGLPGTTGIVEVMLYDDHLAAVAAAEQRVRDEWEPMIQALTDELLAKPAGMSMGAQYLAGVAAGVKAAREAVAAVVDGRGGYHPATAIAAIDALTCGKEGNREA